MSNISFIFYSLFLSSRPGRPPKRNIPLSLTPTIHGLSRMGPTLDLLKRPKLENGHHRLPFNGYEHLAAASPYLLATHPAFLPSSLSMPTNHLTASPAKAAEMHHLHHADLGAAHLHNLHKLSVGIPRSSSQPSSHSHASVDIDDHEEDLENGDMSPRSSDGPSPRMGGSQGGLSPKSDSSSAMHEDEDEKESDRIHQEAMAAMEHSLGTRDLIRQHLQMMNGALSEGAHSRGEEYEQLHGNSTSQSGMPLPGMTATDILSHQVGPSSMETLLTNIQGLLKVASDNARQRDKQINLEKAELKLELLRERELRESMEKQLVAEQRRFAILVRRLKREKRSRRRLQEQAESTTQQQQQQREREREQQKMKGSLSDQEPSRSPPIHTIQPIQAVAQESIRALNGGDRRPSCPDVYEKEEMSPEMEIDRERANSVVRNEAVSRLQDARMYFKNSLLFNPGLAT
ncbi:dachshund homolog 1 isoform X7 [Strongylocentrotus purpuratus]|uniref:Dachshund n=1 Tax=Strongylocentrotus purpuratus TaxID=7668 RepID=A0A7M7NJB5_STRPU|nr:dachshund homolog 1 isoform X7 [Strongylocentrotus purpuratus]